MRLVFVSLMRRAQRAGGYVNSEIRECHSSVRLSSLLMLPASLRTAAGLIPPRGWAGVC